MVFTNGFETLEDVSEKQMRTTGCDNCDCNCDNGGDSDGECDPCDCNE